MSSDTTLDKVKKLRELTGVGFKDCKNAIDENKGDIEKSVELYEKGMLLKNNCEAKLKKVELQIKKIKMENNKIQKEDFK